MFYVIRHGEADYSEVERVFHGFGENFAPLTETGAEQIRQTAKDARLRTAKLIIASPYARALQSAAILSKELQLNIVVEPRLHEWMCDIGGAPHDKGQSDMYCREFSDYRGDFPTGENRPWENNSMLRSRLNSVLEKYLQYDNVIVVCHAMLMYPINGHQWAANGEIVEYALEIDYDKNSVGV